MGLAFVGGFASGMSKSIEKARDRKRKQDDAIAAQNSENAKLAGDIQDKRLRADKLMSDLQTKKNAILSGDTNMNSTQAAKAANAITRQMGGVLNGMGKYAADVGRPEGVIDSSLYDLDTYSVVDGKFMLNKSTETAINNSDGNLRVSPTGHIEQKVQTTNSRNQPIDAQDDNGKPVYEMTGGKLIEKPSVEETTETGNDTEVFTDKRKTITKDTPTIRLKDGRNVYTDQNGKPLTVNGKYRVKSVEKGSTYANKGKAALATAAKTNKKTVFLRAIDQLDDITSKQGKEGWGYMGLSGFMANLLPIGSDRAKGEGFLDTIKANVGFDALQNMRDNSPTGGALGQVSTWELELLQATMTKIDLQQEPEFVKEQLNQLREQYMLTMHGKIYDEESNTFVPMDKKEVEAYKTLVKSKDEKTDGETTNNQTEIKFDEETYRNMVIEEIDGITPEQLDKVVAREKARLRKKRIGN